jgi:hypothetical protein
MRPLRGLRCRCGRVLHVARRVAVKPDGVFTARLCIPCLPSSQTASAYGAALEAKVARKTARLAAAQGDAADAQAQLVQLVASDWRAGLRDEVDSLHRLLLQRMRAVERAQRQEQGLAEGVL